MRRIKVRPNREDTEPVDVMAQMNVTRDGKPIPPMLTEADIAGSPISVITQGLEENREARRDIADFERRMRQSAGVATATGLALEFNWSVDQMRRANTLHLTGRMFYQGDQIEIHRNYRIPMEIFDQEGGLDYAVDRCIQEMSTYIGAQIISRAMVYHLDRESTYLGDNWVASVKRTLVTQSRTIIREGDSPEMVQREI